MRLEGALGIFGEKDQASPGFIKREGQVNVMMADIAIRRCGPHDLEEIRDLSVRTFVETFSKDNRKEDMERYVEEHFSRAMLQRELRHGDALFYLAQVHGDAVGYMKVNVREAQTEAGHSNALEVQRIYVLKAFQGMGVGRMLMDEAVALAKDMALSYIWLGVWEHNLPAIRFYEKMGFEKFGTHVFLLGEDAQTDHLLRLHL